MYTKSIAYSELLEPRFPVDVEMDQRSRGKKARRLYPSMRPTFSPTLPPHADNYRENKGCEPNEPEAFTWLIERASLVIQESGESGTVQ